MRDALDKVNKLAGKSWKDLFCSHFVSPCPCPVDWSSLVNNMAERVPIVTLTWDESRSSCIARSMLARATYAGREMKWKWKHTLFPYFIQDWHQNYSFICSASWMSYSARNDVNFSKICTGIFPSIFLTIHMINPSWKPKLGYYFDLAWNEFIARGPKYLMWRTMGSCFLVDGGRPPVLSYDQLFGLSDSISVSK